jgi:hypothetical protein
MAVTSRERCGVTITTYSTRTSSLNRLSGKKELEHHLELLSTEVLESLGEVI